MPTLDCQIAETLRNIKKNKLDISVWCEMCLPTLAWKLMNKLTGQKTGTVSECNLILARYGREKMILRILLAYSTEHISELRNKLSINKGDHQRKIFYVRNRINRKISPEKTLTFHV